MRITDITAQRKSENRVNVFLDGSYWVSLDIAQVIDLGIKIGKEISGNDKKRIEYESGFGKAYAAALNLISVRVRSKKEIADYARRKKWDEDTTRRVIERLELKGFLNDQFFASKWVEARAHLKPRSKRKIQAELQQKGIKGEQAQSALSTYDEQAALKLVIAKKQTKYSDPTKFMAYLLRQGFRYSDIKEILTNTNEAVD